MDDSKMAAKRSFQHNMLREIHEQPEALARTFTEATAEAPKIAAKLRSEGLRMIYLTGSGTSYHACLAVNYALSTLTRIPSSTLPASEFPFWTRQTHQPETALIAISQSGESSDMINAATSAAHSGMRTIAVTNTTNSALARMSDFKLVARAGVEKAVTATKSFTSTLLAAYVLILELARISKFPNYETMISLLRGIPDLAEETIRLSEQQTRTLASKFKDREFFFLLGSGSNYATALEGALKLKESCNVYAEGFATREFLHGPIQLIDSRTPVLLLENTPDSEEISELAESFRRFEAPVVIVHPEHTSREEENIQVAGGIHEIFLPLIHVIPLQLYAYYSSTARGLNPDSPAKLRKVVK